MFPPFKPFKSLFGDDPVQKVLEQTHLPNSTVSVSSAITQHQRQNDVLNLTLKWSSSYGEPEAFHQQLSEALHSHGIREINLHLIQEKRQTPQRTATQNQSQSSSLPMPPVVDATAMQSSIPAAPTDPSEQQRQAQTQTPNRPTPPTQAQLAPHPRIRHVIVVASGKGGVGKSTTAVNLALALSKAGAKVGVLDADIYGPSVPAMLGVAGQSPLIENEQFVPLAAHGLAVMSIACLTGDDNTPIVWRGPKATGALTVSYTHLTLPTKRIV